MKFSSRPHDSAAGAPAAHRQRRRLLITGGAGFIGGNFVHYWARTRATDFVVVLDALTYAGNRATIASLIEAGAVTFVHGDICDATLVSTLMAEHDIDTVVHFAAESHVDRSIADPGAFVKTNVIGTHTLLDAARRAWCVDGQWKGGVRFHHVSTDEVYGTLTPTDPAFSETTAYAPSSPYAASKAGSDHLVRAYVHTYGMPATISNCSNNYGPYHFPEKLIPLLIVNALHGKALPVYGDGQQVRDWLFVEDHCVAIAKILEADVAGETFNVGGRAEHVNIDIVQHVCTLLDAEFAADASLAARFPDCPAARGTPCAALITHVQDRPGHDRRYAIDPTKIASRLGFEPAESLMTGLRRTVEWYLANEAWWRGVMDGSYRAWMDANYAERGHNVTKGAAAAL
ncbi:dTDP-glucose 4,6-dehydratase [Gemmatimonas sp.]|uniref:dTDP-glucose 4,6-dehydratase n=1 Tax=Gemmatimonas sp. TaxID=1962908 RepID=UPI003341937A